MHTRNPRTPVYLNIYLFPTRSKDQGKCGSCWAESTVESLADRRCIRSNTGQRLALSALDVIACDKLCEGIEKCCRGCTGGYPKLAFKFFEHTGVVSEACMPYNLTRSLLCPLPRCKKPLDDTAYRAKHTKQVLGGAPSMQKEIATFGPIVATFTVFEDFMTYRSGIYKYSGVGKRLGLHAVKVHTYRHNMHVRLYFSPPFESTSRHLAHHSTRDSFFCLGHVLCLYYLDIE